MSGEVRLKYVYIDNDNSSKTNQDTISNYIEERTSRLLEFTTGDDGLIQLRRDAGNL